jgi:hypothetical protein
MKIGISAKKKQHTQVATQRQDQEKNLSRCACTSTYGIDEDVKEIGSSLCAGELSGLRRQPEEKYFDYSPNCSDNSEKNTSITSPSTSSTAASTAACYARGLIAAAHSRKLSATLGGSTSTRPGVRKLTLKTWSSSTSATR